MSSTGFGLILTAVFLTLLLFAGCQGYSYVRGHVELPDRTRPVVSYETICGYGASGRVTKYGVPDMRYDCSKY